MEETKSVTTDLGFNTQWGKFGAEILLKQWDAALAEMNTLKKHSMEVITSVSVE